MLQIPPSRGQWRSNKIHDDEGSEGRCYDVQLFFLNIRTGRLVPLELLPQAAIKASMLICRFVQHSYLLLLIFYSCIVAIF